VSAKIKPRQLRVLVCGGRHYDEAAAWNWLERNAKDAIAERLKEAAFEIAVIIHGDSKGADQGGAQWGRSEHAQVIAFPANWKRDGRGAGPIRNRKMLHEGKPDIVIALPGGKGTDNMIALAEASGVPVIEVSA
jgi:hypothetical protein